MLGDIGGVLTMIGGIGMIWVMFSGKYDTGYHAPFAPFEKVIMWVFYGGMVLVVLGGGLSSDMQDVLQTYGVVIGAGYLVLIIYVFITGDR